MENGERRRNVSGCSRTCRGLHIWLYRSGGLVTIMVCLYVVVWGALLGILDGDLTRQHEILILAVVLGSGILLWYSTRALLRQQRLLIHQEGISELEESCTLTRVLLDHLPAAVCLKSADHRYLAANVAWARFTGCSLERAIGHTDAELFRAGRAGICRGDDDAVIATGQPVERDLTVTLEGGEHQLRLLKVPVSNRQGKVAEVVGMAFDMTVPETQLAAPGFLPVSIGLPRGGACVVDRQGCILSASTDLQRLPGDVREGGSVLGVVLPAERERARRFLDSLSDHSSAAVEQFHLQNGRAVQVWGMTLAAGNATAVLLGSDVAAVSSPEDR